jgi:hypothetical protein
MKWFRVATEGATTDGRKLTRAWLEQMAAGYNPAIYGARIWLEHLRGLYPDGPFRAYGDVKALKVQDVGGQLGLFAELDPTPDLVAMSKARQKIYSSVEIDPDFAGTGLAYLVGLGVTDSPASLGTEMLAFASGAQANPLSARKQRPTNVFASVEPLDLSAPEDDGQAPPEGAKDGLFSRLAALFRGKAPADADPDTGGTPPPEGPSPSDLSAGLLLLAKRLDDMDEDHDPLDLSSTVATLSMDLAGESAARLALAAAADADRQSLTAIAGRAEGIDVEVAALRAEITALRSDFDAQPNPISHRAPATGGPSTPVTNC